MFVLFNVNSVTVATTQQERKYVFNDAIMYGMNFINLGKNKDWIMVEK